MLADAGRPRTIQDGNAAGDSLSVGLGEHEPPNGRRRVRLAGIREGFRWANPQLDTQQLASSSAARQ